ncbi:hypothetical protein GCM10009715_18350 [Paeniglutamicibacter psychrophenolicus]|uniref:Uncharacterized protein n=1 Tax=Paeniglutamicibacter psychrophenolicus TaxID=257454 RepID=A0ABS4WEU1_9MICC|nr:hypothetical protein [Paeniglutamicibacter psychrophenolicus]MBP2374079.1 hypothetical protein [Paeniglutamicibacter psychrophenolicus]
MRFQLEGPSLESIHAEAVAAHGPSARIVSAEKVTTGGFGRFLAKEHYEAIIEVPDENAPDGRVMGPGDEPLDIRDLEIVAGRAAVGRPSLEPDPDSGDAEPQGSGGGINGLLERADAAELRLAPAPPRQTRRGGRPTVPGAPDFARLLDGQAFALEPSTGARAADRGPAATEATGAPGAGFLPSGLLPAATEARDTSVRGILVPGPGPAATASGLRPGRDHDIVPSPLAGPGDLVVVIGLWGDAGMAAEELHDGTALRRNAGELAQKFDVDSLARRPVTDRRGILRARAAAVAEGVPLLVAVAINPQQALLPQLELLEVLEADQLWAAVDAGRKVEDTAVWVKHVASGHGLYAVVSLHADETLSPESVWELGFPVIEARGPSSG